MKSKILAVVGVVALWLVVGAGLALGQVQSLYAVDNGTDSVIQFDGTTGALIGTFASGNDAGPPGIAGRPYGLTCGPNGNLFVSREETDQVVEFDGTTGEFVRIFASVGLNNPTGLTFAPNGNLLVSNRDGGAIVEFDGGTGTLVGTFAAGGDLALGPFSLAFGPTGNLFVSTGHFAGAGFVLELDGTTGAFVRRFATVSQPRGLAFGPNGDLFVAVLDQPDAVLEFDASTGTLVRTFIGSLTHPHGVTFGPNWNLLVSDLSTGRVVEFDVGTGVEVRTLVPSGSGLGNPIELKFGSSSGPCVTPVAIDIKPGSDPNSTNVCSGGVVPVAILSSATFDATTVDPSTVRLADAAVKMVGKSDKFLCHPEDVDGDGLTDLVCQVVVSDLAIDQGTTDMTATLRATTSAGTDIEGTDAVRVVKDCP